MSNPVHRIRRQRWQVRAFSAGAGFSLRKRLRDEWQEHLLPAFEKAFDAVGSGPETLRIAEVQLHLAIPSEEKLFDLLPELIERQLTERLRDFLRDQPYSKGHQTQLLTKTQDSLDTLLHYLRTGLVPWNTSHRSATDLAVELKETCREYQTRLPELLRGEQFSRPFCFRLLQLLSKAETKSIGRSLLESVSPRWKTGALDLLASLFRSNKGPSARNIALDLGALLLSESLAAKQSEGAPDFVVLAESQLSPPHCDTLRQLIAMLPPASASLLEIRTKPRDFTSPTNQSVSQTDSATLGVGKRAEPSPLASTAADEFPLTVSYAGLILLHPFLARFFESCGLKEADSADLSSLILPRAAALLHFLATGQEEIYEYELGFIKVLLGRMLDQSLCVCEGLLIEGDREEAESLLQATITHWSALKNTSVAGLRSSFLGRQGLLRESDQGWRLQIERLGYDVLIDRLPWGIGIVKLPWLTRPIYTEW